MNLFDLLDTALRWPWTPMVVVWFAALQFGYYGYYLPHKNRRQWVDGTVTITDLVRVDRTFSGSHDVAGQWLYLAHGRLHLPGGDTDTKSIERFKAGAEHLVGQTKPCLYDPRNPSLMTLNPRSTPLFGSVGSVVFALVLVAAMAASAIPGLRAWGIL